MYEIEIKGREKITFQLDIFYMENFLYVLKYRKAMKNDDLKFASIMYLFGRAGWMLGIKICIKFWIIEKIRHAGYLLDVFTPF